MAHEVIFKFDGDDSEAQAEQFKTWFLRQQGEGDFVDWLDARSPPVEAIFVKSQKEDGNKTIINMG